MKIPIPRGCVLFCVLLLAPLATATPPVALKWAAHTLVLASPANGSPANGSPANGKSARQPATLHLDFVASTPVHTVLWDSGGGTIFQSHALGGKETLRLSVRAGLGEGLDAFRGDFSDSQIHALDGVNVCGRPVKGLVATRKAQDIACVISAIPGVANHPTKLLPKRAIAVVFEHGGMPVRLTVEVASKRRDAFGAVEEHFLSSVRCVSPQPAQ